MLPTAVSYPMLIKDRQTIITLLIKDFYEVRVRCYSLLESEMFF